MSTAPVRAGRYQVGMTIGELAERTGIPVKTIRYYSDIGLLPENGRTRGGYRQYDDGAAPRLAFIRTLRELGLGLDTIRGVLERPGSLGEVARAHADALDSQIRILRMHRSVLRTLAQREPTLQEVKRMNDIARASAAERRRVLDDFLDHVFGGLAVNPEFEQRMRSVKPDLPDDPTPEQVDAWVELAELLTDPDFRASIRGMAERHAADPAMREGRSGYSPQTATLLVEKVSAARAAGIGPADERATPVVDEVMAAFAAASGNTDGPAMRAKLIEDIRSGADPRAERYWQLLAVINGWPPFPSGTANWEWFLAALEARQ